MSTVTFENGKTANFEGTPSPEDIDYVAKQMGIQASSNPESSFRYSVPTTPIDKATQQSNIQGDIQKYKSESDYANSPLGFLANTAGAAGSMIAHSELGLGNTLGSILNVNGGNLDTLTNSRQQLSDAQLAAAKEVNNAKQKGQDPTSAMRAYNSFSDQLDQLDSQIKDLTAGSQKTTGEVAGELGGTALDLLSAGTYGKATQGMVAGELATKTPTAVSEAVKLATQPKGLFTATGAGRVLKGTTLGYGYDVANNLQSGATGGQAAIPGIGTALGFGIPALTEGTQSVLNALGSTKSFIAATPESIINGRMKSITQVENSNKSLRNLSNDAEAKGIDLKTIVANTDYLHGSVDDQGVIRTMGKGEAVDQFNKTLDPLESVVSDAIKNEGVRIPFTDVESALRADLENSHIAGASKTTATSAIEKEIEALKLDTDPIDGKIFLFKIQDAKITNGNPRNWADQGVSTIKKAIVGVERTLIESNSSEKVNELNNELSKFYTIRDYFETLDGKRVQGGRMGKYFAETLGGIAGAHFGPLGVPIGAYIAGKLKSSSLAGTFGGELGNEFQTSPLMKAMIEKNKTNVPFTPSPIPPESANPMEMGSYKLGKNKETGRIDLTGQYRAPGINFYPPRKK